MNTTSPRRSDDEIIRSMIEKENDYIHYRVSWFATLQGLLLAALSFAWAQHANYFLLLLCVLGFLVSAIIMHPIYMAHRTMSHLLAWWDAHKAQDYDGPDVIGMRPPNRAANYVAPWLLLPVIFATAWAILFFWRLF